MKYQDICIDLPWDAFWPVEIPGGQMPNTQIKKIQVQMLSFTLNFNKSIPIWKEVMCLKNDLLENFLKTELNHYSVLKLIQIGILESSFTTW